VRDLIGRPNRAAGRHKNKKPNPIEAVEMEEVIKIPDEFKTKRGVRVSISDYDDGVWLHLSADSSSFYAVLTEAEAKRVISQLENVLDYLDYMKS
jgi:hypothetical protein